MHCKGSAQPQRSIVRQEKGVLQVTKANEESQVPKVTEENGVFQEILDRGDHRVTLVLEVPGATQAHQVYSVGDSYIFPEPKSRLFTKL